MPIYEYLCENCKHKQEVMQKISDIALSECPSCRTQGFKKIISASSFVLKGSGWYATDFKTKPSSTNSNSNKTPPHE